MAGWKNKWGWTILIILHILGSSLSVVVLNKLTHSEFLRALSTPPGSNCPDQQVSISVIFLYKLSSPLTFLCYPQKYLHLQSEAWCGYLQEASHRTDAISWQHSVLWHCWQGAEEVHVSGSEQNENQDISGMSADTLFILQESSWFLSPPSSRCGSTSWSIRNLDQSIMREKNGYRLVRIIRISWCSNQHDRFLPSLFINVALPLHSYPSIHKAGFRCLNMGVSCH